MWRYWQKLLQISPKSDTLIFFSKTALTIFLVFGLKLVLNLTFNLNETYFSEKFAIWRYLTSKSSNFGLASKLCNSKTADSLVFLDYAHNDRWAWCLIVFLQLAGPVNVFLFLLIFYLRYFIKIKIFILIWIKLFVLKYTKVRTKKHT